MEAVCARGDTACEVRALAGALHSLNLYCASISAALMCCCAPIHKHYRHSKRWRGQNVRGIASLVLGVAWCCDAAVALLRPADTVRLVAALMAPWSWLAAAAFHVALWTRRSAAPILYLSIYWMLATISAGTILWQHFVKGAATDHVELYIQGVSLLMTFLISTVDCICFYDEVTKRFRNDLKSNPANICYKHNDTHFYSKISFFWLNSLLKKGYKSPLEPDYLGELPEDERSVKYYKELVKIYKNLEDSTGKDDNPSLLSCYIRKVWPNFYIAGILKLFGDLIGVVPPLGLSVIIQYIQDPKIYDSSAAVTLEEFFNNGYVMLLIITMALITQAFLSQNSTHLVTVEGTRLKTALQSMVYDKCMRLAPWSSPETREDEETRLLHDTEDANTTKTGLITNLVSQDTYNIMSCVWICHYIWAIPLKVVVILYLLYTKLGISAIIGTAVSVLAITPLQFYIGKKLSDNSKDIAKCTDHRLSKMAEILHGMDVIKLYVWEDLFKEKILQLRELELKLLNKDSVYWSILTFTTQISSIIITVVTFTVYYFIDSNSKLTATNVFAGLAFFNQLTVPLLILPVTVLMVIQAMVSTKRITDFLELPESNNVSEANWEDPKNTTKEDRNKKNDKNDIDDNFAMNNDEQDGTECVDQFSDDEVYTLPAPKSESLVKFRNAAFSWGKASDMLLEVDDLDIPAGKLIMVVGTTGSGKSSLLSAILGEMYLDRGDVVYNKCCSMWYAGQPPWLQEGSVRSNIVMDGSWCQRKYGRVLRATGLRPDLQLLPEGDATRLGSHGAPLSGGQRIRVCVARALYSDARLLALDEPLAALDAPLARHLVARALVPAARAGRTVLVATNRLELLHYADLVIAMEEGRVSGVGRGAACEGALARWARLAGEARAAAARAGAGPPGGTARERSRLVRALSRSWYQRCNSDETTVGISEAAGAHLLSEVPTCAGGSWRRRVSSHSRPALSRQLSSPPPSMYNAKWRPDVRRAVSADESNATLQREASLLRRWLKPRGSRTLNRWTPKTLRRLISSDSETVVEDNQNNDVVEDSTIDTPYSSLTSNGIETNNTIVADDDDPDDSDKPEDVNEMAIWWEYARACRWWGAVYWAAAAAAQALALAADYWLTYTTSQNTENDFTDQQTWSGVRTYALWCGCGALAAGAAQASGAGAAARARRALHDRLLHATLRAPPHHLRAAPLGDTLHRFSADILVIDKKLPTAISRWAQLALLCAAAILVNAIIAPWTLLASLPALLCYLTLQSIYLCNARELQCAEAHSAAVVVSLCAQACAGASTIRAGRLQPRMRTNYLRSLDTNHNTLLLLNAANRWLGLTLDLVGAGCVCVVLGVCLRGGAGGAVAGLAGAYALLLPAYLAHLAKCRADLHLQLAALERVHADTCAPQEDYRDDCPIPAGWQRNGKIEFQNVNIQHEPGSTTILKNINLTISPGEKVAICGRSGSGKSTLLLTCAGATTISSGRVLVDGQDIRRVPLRALRHRVVLVPQEPAMFSGTLRENLDPLAVHTDEEIWHSLRAVGLFDFVSSQPAGLECSVCSRSGGAGWSAGRAGRVAAARAALHARPAAALLLDEPAAALDAGAERALLAALAAVAPHTTIITVAHRISSVRGYERGVVLESGHVAEQGAVSALLSQPASRLARMLAAAQRDT
ncbi:ATP-binding cassette sub-family C member Sur-like [Spodoptera frugiperda]|uniref:ATP-binding cassette sub-family C member Sur-like n=1 Tax=Spodoptera frugiperda TaxID=7108 RepID=A0A9R0D1I0_SPOFR|nr:ATP-binding cassette sub-family C member Sur-like [Spodoptera frugiperda]